MKKFKKINQLKFEKSCPEYYDLQPMRSSIPMWYKDAPNYNEGQGFWNRNGLKQCIPFLDSLTTGYMIPLPVDVLVENMENGEKYLSWSDKEVEIILFRGSEGAFPPILPGFSTLKVVWKMPMSLELPKGYSMLLTHPLNRFDLPFFTLSGIVDDFKMYSGNIPFIIRDDFEGVIKTGTPIVQILPFKRENWERKNTTGLNEESSIIRKRSSNVIGGFYKHTFWNKKTYN